MSYYATLAQVEAEITGVDHAATNYAETAAQLTLAMAYVTNRLDGMAKRFRFEPVQKVRAQDYAWVDVLQARLKLDAPLLSATSVVDSDDAVLTVWDGTAANRDAAKVRLDPLNDTPAMGLIKLHDTNWTNPETDYGAGIYHVTGLWGYRRDYSNAWKSSLDALAAGISANATSFTVADADGADITGRTPRFSPGLLIRIGTEFYNVTGVNTTTNVVAVEPGVNGSTSAAHLISAAIDVFYPDPTITRATIRWVAYINRRRGQFDEIELDSAGGAVVVPSIPKEVREILAELPPELGMNP